MRTLILLVAVLLARTSAALADCAPAAAIPERIKDCGAAITAIGKGGGAALVVPLQIRAEAYLEKGEVALAIGDLIRITEIDPASAMAHKKLGEAYTLWGETANARTHFDKAKALEAGRPRETSDEAEAQPSSAADDKPVTAHAVTPEPPVDLGHPFVGRWATSPVACDRGNATLRKTDRLVVFDDDTVQFARASDPAESCQNSAVDRSGAKPKLSAECAGAASAGGNGTLRLEGNDTEIIGTGPDGLTFRLRKCSGGAAPSEKVEVKSPAAPPATRKCPSGEEVPVGQACPSGEPLSARLETLSKALETEPRNARLLWQRGEVLSLMGKQEQALEDLDKSIGINPSQAQAFANRGAVYRQLGQLEKALKDLDKAISLLPRSLLALEERGAVYRQMGKTDLAIKDLDKALEIDPGRLTALMDRGAALSAKGRLKEALADLDKAIELGTKDPFAFEQRGRVHEKLGNKDEAKADLGKAEELDAAAN